MTEFIKGRMGVGPVEGPTTDLPVQKRPRRDTAAPPFISSLATLSGMLQAGSPEQFCSRWRELDEYLFELGSRMFGQKEMQDGFSKEMEPEEFSEEEEYDMEGASGI